MKRFTSSLLIAVLLGGFSVFGYADALPGLTLPEVLQHVEDAQRAIKSIQFHFTETVGKAAASASIVGEVSFKRPYQLRVDQAHPEKQTLWSDGETFWLFSPAEGQELTGPWKLWLSRSGFPTPLLSFLSDFTPESWGLRYNVLFGGYDDHLYKIIFKPKTPADSPMDLWLSDSTFLPVRGVLKTNAPVEVVFKNVQSNAELSDRLFKPTVPVGTPLVPLPS